MTTNTQQQALASAPSARTHTLMKNMSPLSKLTFVAVSLLCIGILLWPPRDRAIKVGSTYFVWAGLSGMEFQPSWTIYGADRKRVERRVQFGPVLAVYQYGNRR